MAGLKRILEAGETVTLSLPTGRERLRLAILWGYGFPGLAIALRYLSGFQTVAQADFRDDAAAYALVGFCLMLGRYWLGRPRIAVTNRHILLRRGLSWRRHDRMAAREVAAMDYDLRSHVLSFYGNRRVLAVSCDELSKARIVVALGRLI